MGVGRWKEYRMGLGWVGMGMNVKWMAGVQLS